MLSKLHNRVMKTLNKLIKNNKWATINNKRR
jgi:hypothetical protein